MPAQRRQKRYTIQLRIVALTLLFTVGVSAVIAVGSLRQLNEELERSTLQSAEYALETAASAVARDVEEVDLLSAWCASEASVRTYLLAGVSSSQLSMYSIISTKYNSQRTLPYIQRFLLINTAGRKMMFGTQATSTIALTEERLQALPGYQLATYGWQEILSDPLSLTATAPDTIVISRRLAHTQEKPAYIYLFVSPAMLAAPLKSFALAEGATLYVEMAGSLYTVQGTELQKADWALSDGAAVPYNGATLGASTQLYRVLSAAGEQALAVRYPIGMHDMYLLEVIPTEGLQRNIPMLSESLLVTILAIIALGAALAYLLHRTIARPIAALQRHIGKIGAGDFAADPAIEWNNELGDIGRGINSMAASVTSLMDKRLEDEKQKQDLEYRMLQNQINPHFIYNTLNSIKWMATIQHAPGIAEVVTALSRLLKSVSKGNERLVPLYEEFALLNDYFTIQQYRYGGTITLEVTYIEDETLVQSCLIPRFTLQPLVENAIFHGVEPKGTAGAITLTVAREQETGDILLRLCDDGVGMSAEQIAKALQEPGPEEAAAKFRHVGMWNVHRRLQYSFGERYGLTIESEVGKGTAVIVRLPANGASPAKEDPS